MRPSPLYSVIGALSWPVLHGLYRLEAEGVENVPAGGCVVACNHVSSFDPWPLGLPLWPRRQLRFMAKSELYWWPLTILLNGAGAFPVLTALVVALVALLALSAAAVVLLRRGRGALADRVG